MFSVHHITAGIVLAILALVAPLHAIPIRFLAWDDEIAARKIGFQQGKEIVTLRKLHPNKRSDPLKAAAGDAPMFLVALDRMDTEGNPLKVAIKAPVGFKSPLVLILPDAKKAAGLRTFVIDDDTSSFPWGNLRFINATGKALAIRCEKTVKALPKSWSPVDVSPGGNTRNIPVQVATREDNGSILYSAIWEHDTNLRKLVIIVPSTDVRTGAVQFKVIPEDKRALVPATDVVTDSP